MKRQYRHLAIAGAAMLMIAPNSFADVKTEAYVQENASEVLASLNDPSLDAEERTEIGRASCRERV